MMGCKMAAGRQTLMLRGTPVLREVLVLREILVLREGPLEAVSSGREGHTALVDNVDDPPTRNEDALVCHDNVGWPVGGGQESSCS